jgi:hypothetical protein
LHDTLTLKQTMLLKLVPTPEQAAAVRATLHAGTAACTYAGQGAFPTTTSNKVAVHQLVDGPLRVDSHLPAQLAIRAISTTVDAEKRDTRIQPAFRPDGAMAYDCRVMAFQRLSTVSLLPLHGLHGPILVPGAWCLSESVPSSEHACRPCRGRPICSTARGVGIWR